MKTSFAFDALMLIVISLMSVATGVEADIGHVDAAGRTILAVGQQ